MPVVLGHQFVKAIDICLRNSIVSARRCCTHVINAGKRTTEEGVVHQSKKFRAEQVLLSPLTILIEPVYA